MSNYISNLMNIFYFNFYLPSSRARLGRRPTLLVSLVCSTVLGFTSAFSTSYTMFAVSRALSGALLSGISIVTAALRKKTTHPFILPSIHPSSVLMIQLIASNFKACFDTFSYFSVAYRYLFSCFGEILQ